MRAGVISIHSLNEWFFDQDSIDLGFHEHLKTCKEECHDLCDYDEQSDELFGSWKENDKGEFKPDTSGSFAAIFLPCFSTIQVVWSKYYSCCRPCSPCFPNQGDLDSSEGPLKAYSLPPEELSKEYLERHSVLKI